MIFIKILRADKNKIYTNGKIKGKIVWVKDEATISSWYQIDEKNQKPQKELDDLSDFKKKYDVKEDE